MVDCKRDRNEDKAGRGKKVDNDNIADVITCQRLIPRRLTGLEYIWN